jgi:hypothetical protein
MSKNTVPEYEKRIWETEINVKRPKIRVRHDQQKTVKKLVEMVGCKLSQTQKEAVKYLVSHG